MSLNPLLDFLHRGTLQLIDRKHVLDEIFEPVRDLDVRGEMDCFLHPVHQHHNVFRALPRVQVEKDLVKDHP